MARSVKFCGSIGGRVTVRAGETDEQALARAQCAILAALDRSCTRLGYGDGRGPNVGLELDPTDYGAR